jgi:hypothetical protein
MNHDQIKTYRFDEDSLPPSAVLEHLTEHDKVHATRRRRMALIKALYETEFWRFSSEADGSSSEITPPDQQGEWLEVNRLQGAIDDYESALFPRRVSPVFSRAVNTTGDPKKAELVAAEIINTTRMRRRFLFCIRQALTLRCSAIKVGFEPGPSPVLQRVWTRAMAPWELVVDRDAADEEDARFIGHVTYLPRKKLEERYGLTLKGTARVDHLDSMDADTAAPPTPTTAQADPNATDRSAFVRVLELCNLVDTITEDGQTFRGRLEVYLLDESTSDYSSKLPVWMGPLPLARPDGRPLAHIFPLMFRTTLDKPLDPISYADRLAPQLLELNGGRAHMAEASRRDVRIWLTRDGALEDTELTKLTAGKDGTVVKVSQNYEGRLQDAVVALRPEPVSGNTQQVTADAERDLDAARTTPTQSLGFLQNVTATAIQATVAHTESEFGKHAEVLDAWMIDIIEGLLAALVAAMRDTGQGTGLDDQTPDSPGDVLADEEAIEDKDGQDGDNLPGNLIFSNLIDAATEAEAEADDDGDEDKVEAGDDEDINLDDDDRAIISTQEKIESVEEDGPIAEHVSRTVDEATIPLISESGEILEVTSNDLDSVFTIGFQDQGRSPISQLELRRHLTELLDTLTTLYMTLIKGGPEGAWAYVMLEQLQLQYQLPPTLHPDALLDKVLELVEQLAGWQAKLAERMKGAKKASPEQPPGPPPGPPGAAPPPGPPDAPGPDAGPPVPEQPAPEQPADAQAPGYPPEVIQQLLAVPPAQAVQVLLNNNPTPEEAELLQRIASLPDEAAQREGLAVFLGADA